MTITRTSGRPYPNVRRARQSQGWEATHPTNGKQKYYRAEAAELGAIREQYRAQGEA